MDESIDIPIGGDLSGFNEAIGKLMDTMNRLGAQITAAMATSSAAITAASANLNHLATRAHGASAATTGTATATATLSTHLARAAVIGSQVGNILYGVSTAASFATKATKLLTGVNLVTSLTGWITKAGGIKAAFAKIPQVMGEIIKNPTFQKIAAGAALAVVGILAIRTAWRTAGAAAHLLTSAGKAAFNSLISAAKSAAHAVAATFRGITSLPGKVLGSIPGLPIVGLLSAAGAAALLATQIKAASSDAAAFEDMQVSVAHFTGSLVAAKSLLEDLEKFSIVTPFETTDVQMTAKGLLGAGIREDIAGITKDLSAISSTGQELRDLGDALGKGFAKGKFQTEEMNKFLERGINLVPALQKSVGLTGEAFSKALEKGLSFSQVTTAIKAMSQEGGQFFGLLEKRSLSFNGLVSTLLSAWTNLKKAFAAPLNDALKPILQSGIDKLTTLMDIAKSLGEKVGNAISIAFEAFKSGETFTLLKTGLTLAFFAGVDILMRGLAGAVAFLSKALPPIFESALAKIQDPTFWQGIGLILKSAAAEFGAIIEGSLGRKDLAAALSRQSGLQAQHGSMLIAGAGGTDFGATLVKAVEAARIAGVEAFSAMPKSDNLTASQAALDTLLGKYEARIAADRAFAITKPETPFNSPLSSVTEAANKFITPAAMSLTRIGGGSNGGNIGGTLQTMQLSEARKQTGFLQKIAAKLENPNDLSRFATFE